MELRRGIPLTCISALLRLHIATRKLWFPDRNVLAFCHAAGPGGTEHA
ncbi:MAG TPA: hypothetical protein VGJ15_11655 [Pirellulales bacterium]